MGIAEIHRRKPTSTNNQRLHPVWIALALALCISAWFSPMTNPAAASSESPQSGQPNPKKDLPLLREFIASVQNGQAKMIVGVYVPSVIALPIYQQPAGQPGYVHSKPNAITQFSMAAEYGTVGLLAHNYMAGEQFFDLEKYQNVYLVFGDGRVRRYLISQASVYQALSPNSPYSSFVDPANPNTRISVVEMFNRVYAAGDQVVFQTCVEKDGLSTWGRLFVTAMPREKLLRRSSPASPVGLAYQ